MADNTDRAAEDRIFVNRALEAAIRIGLIALLVAFCFLIVKAFIPTVLWGVIIAIGIFPIHRKLAVALGQREKLAAVNIGAALKALEPYLKPYGLRVFSAGAEVGFTLIKSLPASLL